MAAASEMKPVYLIAGDDEGKIDAALTRLRARAEREGGQGALETFEPAAGGAPDAEALIGAIPALSLTAERRYLLADGVERWKAAQVNPVCEALAAMPPDLTIVLVSRDKAPKKLADAVRKAGGEVLGYEAPRARELPGRLVAGARERGFELDMQAARMLVDRMGTSTVRLGNELDRLALWAGSGRSVGAADLSAMVADTSEEVAWALSDAIVERRSDDALAAAERLADQGEAVTGLIYAVANRLRNAAKAVEGLESGKAPKEVESTLPMHPYAAKMLVRSVRGSSAADVGEATAAFADLEWWTRGGSDYSERVALTLAIRRAAGAGADRA